MDKDTPPYKNKDTWEGHLKFKKCQHPVLTKEEKWKKAWLEEDSKMYAALVAVVKRKSLLNNLAFTQVILKYSICCAISTILKRLHFSYYKMIARSQLAILDYNSGIGLKLAQTKDGWDCFKLTYSKVTENWCVKKILCQKSNGYIEDLLETTVDAQMTTIRQHCLSKIEAIPKHIGSVAKPKKEEATKSVQTRFKVSNTKIN